MIHTTKNLTEKFIKSNKELIKYNILKNQIEEVDMSFVLFNLLKYDFVVDINGDKYDLSFGLNKENGEIGNYQKPYPNSKDFLSYELIEKAFQEGKWFYVTNKNLTKDEFAEKVEEIEKLKDAQESKDRAFIVDRLISACFKKEAVEKYGEDELKNKLMSISKKEFNKFCNELFRRK